MGRGRQKAKQTKVARELKYYTPETDFESLERELTSKSSRADEGDAQDEEQDDFDDDYGRWASGDTR